MAELEQVESTVTLSINTEGFEECLSALEQIEQALERIAKVAENVPVTVVVNNYYARPSEVIDAS